MSNVEEENDNIIKEKIEETTENQETETAKQEELRKAVLESPINAPLAEIGAIAPIDEQTIEPVVLNNEEPDSPKAAEPNTPEQIVSTEITSTANEAELDPPAAAPMVLTEITAPRESDEEKAERARIAAENEEEKARIAAENKKMAEEKQKQFDESFAKLKAARDSDTPIEVLVKDRIKGGLRVMFDDVPIFLPASHCGLRRNPTEEELAAVIGKHFKVYIHELTEDEDNRKTVIVSRKKAITDELWATIKVGDIVEGTVSSIATFGIFLDLGGIEGLVHISRLSQVHVADTKTIAKRGDKMKAVIVEIDKEKNRIALSRKDLQDSPWKGLEEKYPAGTIVKGVIRRFTDFGVYIEIEPGVDGLLRIGEISWTRRIKHPSEVLTLGQEIDVIILAMSEEKNTMHLSIKRTSENPWLTIKEKYEVGNTYNAVVKQVMTQGCVLTIDNEVDGFMPRSKMRQLPRGKKIPYLIGDTIEILISDVLPEQESVIIEPKLNEAEILAAEQEEKRDERPQSPKKNDNKGAENKEENSGSFSFQDLLSEKMKDKLFGNVNQ